MRQFGLVFTYSFMERLRSKAFKVMTIVMILILAALIILPKFLGDAKNIVDGDIAVLDTTGIVTNTDGFKQQVSDSYNWRLIQESDLTKEKTKLENEDNVLGIVTISQQNEKPILTLTVNKMDDASSYVSQLNSYVQNLYTLSEMNKLELNQLDKERLTASVQVEVQELKVGSKSIMTTYMPIYIITFLLYILIYLFGGNVATSVSVEKGSRVKEILITKVKPVQLLFGKVFGVGLAGLLQFAIIIGAAYLMLIFTGSGSAIEFFGYQIDFTFLDGRAIAVLSIFFILGYFFYAALFAATGSLVSRSEEINQVTLPVSLMLMAALVVAVISMMNVDGPLAVICSYIPLFTPFVMFIRVGMSDPTWMEILIPTLILFLSTIGACWLSAKIYQVGVLLYGQKPTPKLIFKAMRSL
ncbi:ABC-2 family transporter protein [compost metagenome]